VNVMLIERREDVREVASRLGLERYISIIGSRQNRKRDG
jgi:hypothetical protein